MRAITFSRFGDPSSVLEVSTVEKPTPRCSEALIRVVYSSVHNQDLAYIAGKYGAKPTLPAIAGTEAVGIVEAVGRDVSQDLVGQRVTVAGSPGCWAEYFTAPSFLLFPIPDEVPDLVASQIVATPFSALALLYQLEIGAGDWVVQSAANGTFGRLFASFAAARGIHVLNLVRRTAAIEEVQETVKMKHILATDTDNWKMKAKTILPPSGADVAIDSTGTLVSDMIELLKPDSSLVVYGNSSESPLTISSEDLIYKHINLKGFWSSRAGTEMHYDTQESIMQEITMAAIKGNLPVASGGCFAIGEIKDAIHAAQTHGRSGKIILKP